MSDVIQNGERNTMKKEKIQIVHLQMVKDREVPYGKEYINSPGAQRQTAEILSMCYCKG